MALLPYGLRPKTILRRRAMRAGLLRPGLFGPASMLTFGWRAATKGPGLWRVVGAVVFTRELLSGSLGKQPERLGTYRVSEGSFLRVNNTAPLGRKERKRLGITKQALIAQAVADVEAARPGTGTRVVK